MDPLTLIALKTASGIFQGVAGIASASAQRRANTELARARRTQERIAASIDLANTEQRIEAGAEKAIAQGAGRGTEIDRRFIDVETEALLNEAEQVTTLRDQQSEEVFEASVENINKQAQAKTISSLFQIGGSVIGGLQDVEALEIAKRQSDIQNLNIDLLRRQEQRLLNGG